MVRRVDWTIDTDADVPPSRQLVEAVLEFALGEDRVTPPPSATFDLVMLATTPQGEAYTIGEYGKMFADAGLARPERHDLPDGSHTVLLAGAAQ